MNDPAATSVNEQAQDRSMQMEVGVVLRVGLAAAVILVAIGGVLYLVQSEGSVPDYGTFDGVAARLKDPATIIQDAVRGDALAVIQLGLMVLVLTPVARVVFTLVAFIRQHDRLYIGFTLIVLIVLSLGLTGHAP